MIKQYLNIGYDQAMLLINLASKIQGQEELSWGFWLNGEKDSLLYCLICNKNVLYNNIYEHGMKHYNDYKCWL